MNRTTLILSFFLLLLVPACKNQDIVLQEGTSAKRPEQEIENFTAKQTKEGKPDWILNAASAQILETEKKIFLDAPKILFYEKGVEVSDLVAEKGRINTENYDIWGDGDCLLTTRKGEVLKTRNLHYRSDIKKIVTDEKVKLIRPDEVIDGQGLEATPDLETIIIKKQKVTLNK